MVVNVKLIGFGRTFETIYKGVCRQGGCVFVLQRLEVYSCREERGKRKRQRGKRWLLRCDRGYLHRPNVNGALVWLSWSAHEENAPNMTLDREQCNLLKS